MPINAKLGTLEAKSTHVSSGVFVTSRTSAEIFGRTTLTDALVVARAAADVPSLVASIQQAFRLEPGVFVTERYSEFRRKVHDFVVTSGLFTAMSLISALLAGSFAANLLNDVYAERQRQYAILIALGSPFAAGVLPALALGMAIALASTIVGGAIAVVLGARTFAVPSLMAGLGTVEPRMDWIVAGATLAVAIVAVGAGIFPTAWKLRRQPVAAMLSDSRP